MTPARKLMRAIENPDATAFLLRLEIEELRGRLDKAERQRAAVLRAYRGLWRRLPVAGLVVASVGCWLLGWCMGVMMR